MVITMWVNYTGTTKMKLLEGPSRNSATPLSITLKVLHINKNLLFLPSVKREECRQFDDLPPLF